jgi:formylglycine-generating enzyme required for sulfatase activity
MVSRIDFFQAGGSLSADSPSYIERPADTELIKAVTRGELCLVLAPRQTGKSSLMVQATARLDSKGFKAGIVDFQPLGSHWDPNSWFSDMIYQIERSLKLKTDSTKWWEKNSRLGPTQRFMTFLEDVVLGDVEGDVVIFFDEIDSVLPLPFSDDFFTTIRALYNARASNSGLKRLNFVLLGVATASELVKNKSRTPFNIGREIDLQDFDPLSLKPFEKVLGNNSEPLVERLFYWTDGQPLLIQKLTEAVYAKPEAERSVEFVDEIVQKLYLDTKIGKDTHLKFIRDYLLADIKRTRKTLSLYKKVLGGEDVNFDDQSPTQSRLKLAGVVKTEKNHLIPRNRIYQNIFDAEWINRNSPRDITRRVAYGASTALLLVLIWFVFIQPIFFPKFSRFLTGNRPLYIEDIKQIEKLTSLRPSESISRIELDGQELTISIPSNVERSIEGLKIDLKNLPIGISEHNLRFYGKLWRENFEMHFTVVYFPETEWKPLGDLEMIEVSEGCFEMGCGEWDGECNDDELPGHQVCLSSYMIGRYEVTQEQWERLMGHNPSSSNKGNRYPVESVNWEDIQVFIRRLNKMTGLKYRLPTEAEWEYAARSGGKPEKYAGGNDLENLSWYNRNSEGETHLVGTKDPNGLGIHDMSGNILEWCADWYSGDFYSNSPDKNPTGPETGDFRVIRGGGWDDDARNCRSAARSRWGPVNRGSLVGFRLSRSVSLGS